MKPISRARRLLSEILYGMAMCDPYRYGHLVCLEAKPAVGSEALVAQKTRAAKDLAGRRRSAGASPQP